MGGAGAITHKGEEYYEQGVSWLESVLSPDTHGRLGGSVDDLINNRGTDAVEELKRRYADHGGQIEAVAADPLYLPGDPSYIFQFNAGGRMKNAHAIDSFARQKDPVVLNWNNGNRAWGLEQGVILSTVLHKCAGLGSCVPAAIWDYTKGDIPFNWIQKDLRNNHFKYGPHNDLSGDDLLLNPLEGTPTFSMAAYVDATGGGMQKPQNPNDVLTGYASLSQRDRAMVMIEPKHEAPGRGHIFAMHGGVPVAHGRWDYYLPEDVRQVVMTTSEGWDPSRLPPDINLLTPRIEDLVRQRGFYPREVEPGNPPVPGGLIVPLARTSFMREYDPAMDSGRFTDLPFTDIRGEGGPYESR